jgi:hypothetical protein
MADATFIVTWNGWRNVYRFIEWLTQRLSSHCMADAKFIVTLNGWRNVYRYILKRVDATFIVTLNGWRNVYRHMKWLTQRLTSIHEKFCGATYEYWSALVWNTCTRHERLTAPDVYIAAVQCTAAVHCARVSADIPCRMTLRQDSSHLTTKKKVSWADNKLFVYCVNWNSCQNAICFIVNELPLRGNEIAKNHQWSNVPYRQVKTFVINVVIAMFSPCKPPPTLVCCRDRAFTSHCVH